MSVILYYSNFCEHSKELLQYLTKQSFTSINYLCIDKRFSKNGSTYIIMENQKHIVLPSIITSVPSLLLLDDANKILFGKDIYKYFKPKQLSLIKDATNNDEPQSFTLNSTFGNAIASDTFSFYDMDSSDMTAKGDGGVRQMHTYATINFNDKIETPDEDYASDTIGEISIEKLQSQRNSEIPQPNMRI